MCARPVLCHDHRFGSIGRFHPVPVLIALSCLLLASGCGDSKPSQPRRNVAAPPGINLPTTAPQGSQPAAQARNTNTTPKPTSTQQPTRQPIKHAAKAPPADQNATDQNGSATGSGAPDGQSADGSGENAGRPDDVAKWKPADYLNAKVENDPRLVEAVHHAGENFATSPNAAKTLAKLLAVTCKDSAKDSQNPQNQGRRRPARRFGRTARQPGQVSGPVAQAIIAALGKNTTRPAYDALIAVISGKLKTPLNPRNAVSEVLKVISPSENPAHQKILFKLATNPQAFRSAAPDEESNEENRVQAVRNRSPRRQYGGGSEVTPDWLQGETLSFLEPVAGVELRKRLAEFLNDPKIPVETADPLEEFLAKVDPRNLSAQVVLYQNRHTTEQVKIGLEEQLTAGSSAAIAYLLGVAIDDPSNGGRGRFGRSQPRPGRTAPQNRPNATGRLSRTGRPSRNDRNDRNDRDERPSENSDQPPEEPVVDPKEAHRQIARQLWQPQIASLLDAELQDTDDDSLASSNALLLAGTIPTGPTRQTLYRLLEDRKEAGSQPWKSAGLLGREVCDPAILVFVKNMYHERLKANKRGSKRRRPSNRGRTQSPTYNTDRESQDSEVDSWTKETEHLVAELCARLDEAAKSSHRTGRNSGGKASEGQLELTPVKLHKDANVVAQYHVRWPEQAIDKLPGVEVAPLELHYVRMEEEERPKLLLTHYRRQNRRGHEHDSTKNLVWLDGLLEQTESATQRSIDIRIDGVDINDKLTEPVSLVIEVLTIEIPQPGRDPAATAATERER